ncbi:MAG: sugar phosphate isomerase/epimerase [Thaumarchaeota archaeon]|nr:sugar phosphate isomerase/epimerase [Nitrososphaerota archaeon]
MHGRLSPSIENKIQSFPIGTWKNEFEQAAACNFECIEWIFDQYENNPIINDESLSQIKLLSEKHDVRINSVLADYFMEKKFFNETPFQIEKNLDMLKKLIKSCNKIGIPILEIPFVDSSSILTSEHEKVIVGNLNKISSLAQDCGLTIALETDLPPIRFKSFLDNLDPLVFFANYDTGNSAALGYDMKEEIETLSNKIKNIHIKDRLLHGKTVPLGTGAVNFDLFFSNLKKIDYKGDLIIQGAREIDHSPIETCEKYLKFVKQYVDKYFN